MRFAFASLVFLLTATGPLTAQARLLQSPEGLGLALVESLGGYRVEDPLGRSEPIVAPEGAILGAFHELDGGWIAAGHRRSDDGSEIVLIGQTGGEPRRIEPPIRKTIGFRMAPVPLIESGRLSGLAWLEGDSGERNAVMASRWTGDGWEAVETVSPMTGEAQLALSGAVLGDGSSLLVWAAVDEGDDDVLWSRYETGQWSAPAKVHPDNDVPDIVPRVVAVEGGALVAWSQFDGRDYRLRVARLADGSWTDTGFAGEEGSFSPTPFPTPGGAGFLYPSETPRSWCLIEVEADGRLRRKASMRRAGGEQRPMVRIDEPGLVQVRFAAESVTEEVTSGQLPWHEIEWIEQP